MPKNLRVTKNKMQNTLKCTLVLKTAPLSLCLSQISAWSGCKEKKKREEMEKKEMKGKGGKGKRGGEKRRERF